LDFLTEVVHIQGRISRGSKGSSKVLLRPAIPYHFPPCRWPTPGRPNTRGLATHRAIVLLYSRETPWTPMKYGNGCIIVFPSNLVLFISFLRFLSKRRSDLLVLREKSDASSFNLPYKFGPSLNNERTSEHLVPRLYLLCFVLSLI
jgi:hypothetical protein